MTSRDLLIHIARLDALKKWPGPLDVNVGDVCQIVGVDPSASFWRVPEPIQIDLDDWENPRPSVSITVRTFERLDYYYGRYDRRYVWKRIS